MILHQNSFRVDAFEWALLPRLADFLGPCSLRYNALFTGHPFTVLPIHGAFKICHLHVGKGSEKDGKLLLFVMRPPRGQRGSKHEHMFPAHLPLNPQTQQINSQQRAGFQANSYFKSSNTPILCDKAWTLIRLGHCTVWSGRRLNICLLPQGWVQTLQQRQISKPIAWSWPVPVDTDWRNKSHSGYSKTGIEIVK